MPFLFLAALAVLFMTLDKKTKSGLAAAVGYINGKAFALTLVDIGHGGKQLASDAAAAFLAMEAAANADGVSFQVNSAWRSNVQQDSLYAAYVAGRGNLAAPPGYSNHQAGTAVDIDSEQGSGAAFRWLTARAGEFKFRRTVSSEPWHWEFMA